MSAIIVPDDFAADGLSVEYHANARRLSNAIRACWKRKDLRYLLPPCALEHVEKAIAAADGAAAGYNFRDDELYIRDRKKGTDR